MMNTIFEKTLTDVENGIYLKDWKINNEDLKIDRKWVIDKRRLEGGISDGVDIITVNNGVLSFTVVPTRGMGLWRGEFKGTTLGWNSPVKNLVHPYYINLETRKGVGYGFNEWILRCGFEDFPGRIANIPAEEVKVRVTSVSEVELEVEGVAYERAFFGPNFKISSIVSTALSSNTIHVKDLVENLKNTTQEMQLLYHCNYGAPFLEEGAHIIAPFKMVVPRDARAAAGIKRLNIYGPPETGFTEQVYFCELKGNRDGKTEVALINRDETKAVSLSFSLKELPCFTLWKNTNSIEEGYVTGLEPATFFPNTKIFEQEHNRIVNLGPKEIYKIGLDFSVHFGKEKVLKLKDKIENLKEGVEPKIYRKPEPFYSPS
jgi:hypothetical protein